MTSKQSSESQPKLPPHTDSTTTRERIIAAKLSTALNAYSFREIGRRTGYHSETVRRYLIGRSKIPADFLSQVCKYFEWVDANCVLNTTAPEQAQLIRNLSTQQIIAELGRRMELIENNTVSKILLQAGFDTYDKQSE